MSVLEATLDLADDGAGRRRRARRARIDLIAELRDKMRNGTYAIGDQLPTERELAERYNVSRKTVQHALGELSRLGLVERRVGSGTFVCAPVPAAPVSTVPSVSPVDAIETRRVIEPGFAELAVARATEEDFERMRERLREMETAPDQVAFKKAGYDFHLEVARATRNPLLVAIYEVLIAARAKAGWDTLLALNDRSESREAQIECNRSIYEALRDRDAARAAEISRTRLREMQRTVMSFPPGS